MIATIVKTVRRLVGLESDPTCIVCDEVIDGQTSWFTCVMCDWPCHDDCAVSSDLICPYCSGHIEEDDE